jgi:phosphate starvation-inducible protein PhoH and related proteins
LAAAAQLNSVFPGPLCSVNPHHRNILGRFTETLHFGTWKKPLLIPKKPFFTSPKAIDKSRLFFSMVQARWRWRDGRSGRRCAAFNDLISLNREPGQLDQHLIDGFIDFWLSLLVAFLLSTENYLNLSNLRKLELPPQGLNTLFGVQDQNIKYLESLLDVNIGARGNELLIDGDERDIKTVEQILRDFGELFDEGNSFTDKELRDAFKQIAEDRAYSLKDHFLKARFNPSGKKQVAPKTANQRKYLDAIAKNDLVFGIGVAGTGKSFLAVAMAVDALFKKQVSRIILTRPAVEAGERLGFLPGDLQDKVDPYLRPLYDALFDLVDSEKITKMLEKRIIEIAPLAFMRGRTLSDAFIILDEAQNTTSEQMKMFLTRIGFGSKAVVTGDKTQIDLPRGQKSGIKEAEHILANLEGIEFVYFTEKGVVRHKLVQMIVKAYEAHSEQDPQAEPRN